MTVLAFLCVLGALQAILLGAVLFCAKHNQTANRLLGAFAWIAAIFIAAAVMTLFCVLLFVYALGLPFQLWPQANAHVILFKQFEEIFYQLWIILLKLIPIRG